MYWLRNFCFYGMLLVGSLALPLALQAGDPSQFNQKDISSTLIADKEGKGHKGGHHHHKRDLGHRHYHHHDRDRGWFYANNRYLPYSYGAYNFRSPYIYNYPYYYNSSYYYADPNYSYPYYYSYPFFYFQVD